MPNADPRRLRDPKRLAEVQRVLPLLENDPAMVRLTRLASRVIRAPIALLTILDDDDQIFISHSGLPADLASAGRSPVDESYCQHTVATGAPLIIRDVRTDPFVHDKLVVEKLYAVSYAAMPIKTPAGESIGSFCVMDHTPRDWSDEEISILGDIANEVMTEIALRFEVDTRQHQEYRLGVSERALEASINRLMILRRIDSELSETLDIDEVLALAMDTALRATDAEHGMIALIEGDLLRTIHAVGGVYQAGAVYDQPGIIGRVIRTGFATLTPDVHADPDYAPTVPSTRAQMTFPLAHRERMIGILSLETAHPERFTGESFDFLNLVTGRITLAIDNARLHSLTQQQLSELRDAHARVSDLERLKTDMIRLAAHDLRSPLSIITGFADLLLSDDQLSKNHRTWVEAISKGSRRMDEIIKGILSLEQIGVTSTTEHQTIDLTLIAQQAFEVHRPNAQERMHVYTLDAPTAALWVSGDAAQMVEVIDNLISNAIKYTPDGGSVRLKLTREGGDARLEVIDTGVGIPDDQQQHLFQPFFRARTAETDAIEGTGLGLHLVKRIIERHGGAMLFESVYHRGSRFGFTLPLLGDAGTAS